MAKPTVMVREYDDVKGFNKDAQKLAKDGWTVQNTVNQDQKKGFAKSVLVPFTRKKSHIVVTYTRQLT